MAALVGAVRLAQRTAGRRACVGDLGKSGDDALSLEGSRQSTGRRDAHSGMRRLASLNTSCAVHKSIYEYVQPSHGDQVAAQVATGVVQYLLRRC